MSKTTIQKPVIVNGVVVKRQIFKLSASSPEDVNLSATVGSNWLRGEYYLGEVEEASLPGKGQTRAVLVYPHGKGPGWKSQPVVITNRNGDLFEAVPRGRADVSVIRVSPQDDGTAHYTPWWTALEDYGPSITPVEAFRLMREGAVVEIALNDPDDTTSHWEASTGRFRKI